ncbi:hypothetical protein [Methylobacterium sp. JK268]
MAPEPTRDAVPRGVPRGGLQAAEFEDKRYGLLRVDGRSVIYVAHEGEAAGLRFTYPSEHDARAQLSFFRAAYQDLKRHRAAPR